MQKKLTKPFITYFEQLNNLIQKKHLNISNLSYAKNKLLNIGYYSLIDGYKDIFYNPMTRTYEKGTNFTDIVALYDFDENLRSLVFKYICHIEQKIRSLISYSFCEVFSENQAAYLNSANYNISKTNRYHISKLISKLTYEATKKHRTQLCCISAKHLWKCSIVGNNENSYHGTNFQNVLLYAP